MSLIDLFDRGVLIASDEPALTDPTDAFTYAEADLWSRRIAAAMHENGVLSGDGAAVLSPNHAKGFLAMLGIWRSGAVWVPLNTRNAPAANAEFVETTRPKILFFHSSQASQVAELRERGDSLTMTVCLDAPTDGAPDLLEWAKGHDPDRPTISRGPDSVAVYMATGGTTGRSKATVLTDRVFDTMVANFIAAIGMPDGERPVHLLATPMSHASGFCALPLMAAGAHNVFLPDFDIAGLCEAIGSHGVTHLFLPPTVIYMMLAHPEVESFDYSSLRNLIYAAAPMSADKLRRAIELFGPVMTQFYGQAEAPLTATCLPPQDHQPGVAGAERRLWSCGRRTIFSSVAVMDDDGHLLGSGERGEIVINGPLLMDGYLGDPAATEAIRVEGWQRTGDVGEMDDDGYLYIVDRKKDMIITGGFNVYPSEVEQWLWAHEAIRDCAVIGVPDPKWGEAVTAVLEATEGSRIDEAELIAYCRDGLGPVKAPKRIEVWDELPRSPVGKVLKRDIRDRFWQGQERAV